MSAFDAVASVGENVLSDLDRELCEHLEAGRIENFLHLAILNRYSILLSGGTSSGKTTFLNALLKEVPAFERVLTIEDTREVVPLQPNHLPLIASKGDQGEARVTIETLLQVAMRLRPDRIFLGEIRGAEAYSFLRAVTAYAVSKVKQDQKTCWIRIGAAFPHEDGIGFTMVLDALPVDGRIVVRPPLSKEEA